MRRKNSALNRILRRVLHGKRRGEVVATDEIPNVSVRNISLRLLAVSRSTPCVCASTASVGKRAVDAFDHGATDTATLEESTECVCDRTTTTGKTQRLPPSMSRWRNGSGPEFTQITQARHQRGGGRAPAHGGARRGHRKRSCRAPAQPGNRGFLESRMAFRWLPAPIIWHKVPCQFRHAVSAEEVKSRAFARPVSPSSGLKVTTGVGKGPVRPRPPEESALPEGGRAFVRPVQSPVCRSIRNGFLRCLAAFEPRINSPPHVRVGYADGRRGKRGKDAIADQRRCAATAIPEESASMPRPRRLPGDPCQHWRITGSMSHRSRQSKAANCVSFRLPATRQIPEGPGKSACAGTGKSSCPQAR